ncbi:hypothetical protein SK128_015363 [Halocaridina rubra]|uniref:Uncharacterized protein n=1 Tax=Halocaridina rubra TaxID=373956 RepID=A0AAN8XV68_HALRR
MAEDDVPEAEHVICEFSSHEDPPWIPLFSQKYTNYKGLVNTLADAKEILRRLEVSTCTRYAVWNTNKKNFGLTEFSPFARPFRIFWGPDLVPYVVLNRKVLDCQHGRDRKVAWKQKQRALKILSGDEEKAAVKRRKRDPNLKAETVMQNGELIVIGKWTKKYDCPAQVIFQEILRFPEYKLIKNTKWTEITTVRVLKKDLKALKNITCVRGFIVSVPENNQHQNHVIGPGIGMWRPVEPQILNWMQAMIAEGLTSVLKMRKNLRHLVKENYPNVDLSNSAFYPNIKTIAYHIHLIRMRLLGTKSDPKHLEPQKGRFRKEKDEEQCDFFLLPAQKSLMPYNEHEVITEVSEAIQDFEDMQDHKDMDGSSEPLTTSVVVTSTPTKPLQVVSQEFRDLLLQMQSYSFSVKSLPAMQKAKAEVEQAFTNLKRACVRKKRNAASSLGSTPNLKKRKVERIEVKCEKVVDLKPLTLKQITYPSTRRIIVNSRSDSLSIPHEVAAVKLELTDDGSILNIAEYM